MEPPRKLVSLARSGGQATRMLFGRPPYIYCGFVGAGNLGDEAMFEAIRNRLDLGNPLATVPGTPTFPLRLRSPLRRTPFDVVLGGGTLIGRYGWLDRVRSALGSREEPHAVSLGTGVEDPNWSTEYQLSDPDELKRWAALLSTRFDRVSVRGPRSAATLNEFGVDARVVGDPALLLAPAKRLAHTEEGVVAMNVGASGPIWGAQAVVNARVSELARELIRRGFQIRFVVMWSRDQELTESLAAGLPPGATTVVSPRTTSDLMSELSRADVVIGQRLHSVVLAAAAHIPAISLAYRPKCQDFQESINRARFALRTDQLETAELVELTLELANKRDAEAEAIGHSVNRLRETLLAEISQCRNLLSAR